MNKKSYILGFISAIVLVILVWAGGWYKDVFYELSTFNYDKATPVKCSGWQNRWSQLLGAGHHWTCPETTWDEFSRWCDANKSWNWEYPHEGEVVENYFFFVRRCENGH